MEQTPHPLPIVVGVDGSRGSRVALRFALEEGLARHATVRVVTAWSLGPTLRETITDTVRNEQDGVARRLQDEILAEVIAELPAPPDLARLAVHGDAGETLIAAAHESSMLVVGSGHKGLLSRAVVGSVSEFCVRHATVPVVVVPDPARTEHEAVPELVEA